MYYYVQQLALVLRFDSFEWLRRTRLYDFMTLSGGGAGMKSLCTHHVDVPCGVNWPMYVGDTHC